MRVSIILAALLLLGCRPEPDIRSSVEGVPALIALSALAALTYFAQQSFNNRPLGFVASIITITAAAFSALYFFDRGGNEQIDKIYRRAQEGFVTIMWFLYTSSPKFVLIIVVQAAVAFPFSFYILLCALPLAVMITWYRELVAHHREEVADGGDAKGSISRSAADAKVGYLHEHLTSQFFGLAIGGLITVVIFWPSVALYIILLSLSYIFVMPVLSAAISVASLPAKFGMYTAALLLMIEQSILGVLLLDAIEKTP